MNKKKINFTRLFFKTLTFILFTTFIFSTCSLDGDIDAIREQAGLGSNIINNTFSISNSIEWNNALTTIRNNGSGTTGNYKTYVIEIIGSTSIPGIMESIPIQGSTSAAASFGSVEYIEVTLTGNGTLSLSSNGSILYIAANQKLIIDSANLILQGRNNNNNAVLNIEGGSLELQNGTIRGNSGGGVNVSGGTFTMSNGTISGNSSFYGGGVRVNNGIFTMSGGIISDNTATNDGAGGVHISVDSTFTMSGGTISNNTALYGGGVYTRATFIMSGGTISGNTANSRDGDGGGVYVHWGIFTMEGGKITSNTTIRFGGGVTVNGGTFTMNDGIISNNVAGDGGGVHSWNGSTLTMTGGTINGNTAIGSGGGGGIYVRGPSDIFTKSGDSIIYGNNAVNVANKNTANYGNGHAVFWDRLLIIHAPLYRNSTLGEGVNISTTNPNSGWGQ